MQCAIDNAKRQFDIDLNGEIKRIKKDLNVQIIGYPSFWLLIHPEFNRENINYKLKCPMNYMNNLKLTKFRNDTPTLPMEHFFVKHNLDVNRRQCRKVEEFIEQYDNELKMFVCDDIDWNDNTHLFLLIDDFDNMIESIKKLYISKSYIGLYSWLLDRGFGITQNVKCQVKNSKLNKNRSLLLKVLYDVNKNNLLNSFKKN